MTVRHALAVNLRVRPAYLWRSLVWLSLALAATGWRRASYLVASLVRFDASVDRGPWVPMTHLSAAVDQTAAQYRDGTRGAP